MSGRRGLTRGRTNRLLQDLQVEHPARVLDEVMSISLRSLESGQSTVANVTLRRLLSTKLNWAATDRCTLLSNLVMHHLRICVLAVQMLAAMILARFSSRVFRASLLSEVKRQVPKTVRSLMIACGRVVLQCRNPADLFTSAFRKAEHNGAATKSAGKGRKYARAIIRHCNTVRKEVLKASSARQAMMAFRVGFGCLTGENIQHALIRYDVAHLRARPFLVGDGAKRGILTLQGRSRLARSGDGSWPQILHWQEDLRHAKKLVLSTLRVNFSGVRGSGRSPQVKGPVWLSEYGMARSAMMGMVQNLDLEDEDGQFLMCELGKRAATLMVRLPG